MFKVNNKDTRTTPGVVLVSLSLTLNILQTLFQCFYFFQFLQFSTLRQNKDLQIIVFYPNSGKFGTGKMLLSYNVYCTQNGKTHVKCFCNLQGRCLCGSPFTKITFQSLILLGHFRELRKQLFLRKTSSSFSQ